MEEIFVQETLHTSDPAAIEPGQDMVDYIGDKLVAGQPLVIKEIIDIAEARLSALLSTSEPIPERARRMGLLYLATAAALRTLHNMNRMRTKPYLANYPEEMVKVYTAQAVRRFGAEHSARGKRELWQLWHFSFCELCAQFDECIRRGDGSQVLIRGDWVIEDPQEVLSLEKKFLERFRAPPLPDGDTAGRVARASQWTEQLSNRGQALYTLYCGLTDGRIKIGDSKGKE